MIQFVESEQKHKLIMFKFINISLHPVLRFRLAVLRKWRSKYGPNATYKNLANYIYSADKLDMVEAVCQALGAPSNSVIQQEEGLS